MKTLKFTAFLFYKYYSTGSTKEIPYFSTLCALDGMLGLHLYQLFVISNKMSFIAHNVSRIHNYITIGLWLIPITAAMALFIKPNELKSLHYDELTIKKGYLNLIVYLICSVAFLTVLIVVKRGKI